MRGKGFSMLVRSKGFTLVELLVTISILSILMTVALISYGNVQKNGRDAKRKSDISSIQAALEQYHADQGLYPTGIPVSGTVGPLTNQIGLSPTPSPVKTYLPAVPQETQTGIASYAYTKYPSGCDNTVSTPSTYCTSYCLYATVENNSNAATAPICGGAVVNQYQTQAP